MDSCVLTRSRTESENRQRCVKIRLSQWGRSPWTLSGPKHLFVHINDLQTPRPIYKYGDDSTIFEICNEDMVFGIQDSADLVEQWSYNNDMRINTTKIKEMVICFRRDRTFVDYLP